MRKLIIFTILTLIVVVARPQKRRAAGNNNAIPALQLAKQAIDDYDFERAEEIIEKEITALKKKKLTTTDAENLLHATRQGRIKLHATERIVIIDSIVCKKEEALKAIHIGKENGRIDTYASTYHTKDTNGATIYENEFANKRYLAVPDKDNPNTLKLAVSDKIANQWSEPVLLTGLNADETQNYPFLLSDGLTLYYAAKGTESIGKYDIFVSRADGEDGSFLAPENMGFPFNSISNDYLLAIDEYYQLGWFVTDRRQEEGNVCIYIFIPNETREIFDDSFSEQDLRKYAKINSIKDTWKFIDSKALAEARQRLENLKTDKNNGKVKRGDFTFPIDNDRTYFALSDFKSAEARNKMQEWLNLSKTNATDATMLSRLRDNYSAASSTQKEQLKQTILDLEKNVELQERKLNDLAKEIRNTEIANQ